MVKMKCIQHSNQQPEEARSMKTWLTQEQRPSIPYFNWRKKWRHLWQRLREQITNGRLTIRSIPDRQPQRNFLVVKSMLISPQDRQILFPWQLTANGSEQFNPGIYEDIFILWEMDGPSWYFDGPGMKFWLTHHVIHLNVCTRLVRGRNCHGNESVKRATKKAHLPDRNLKTKN